MSSSGTDSLSNPSYRSTGTSQMNHSLLTSSKSESCLRFCQDLHKKTVSSVGATSRQSPKENKGRRNIGRLRMRSQSWTLLCRALEAPRINCRPSLFVCDGLSESGNPVRLLTSIPLNIECKHYFPRKHELNFSSPRDYNKLAFSCAFFDLLRHGKS